MALSPTPSPSFPRSSSYQPGEPLIPLSSTPLVSAPSSSLLSNQHQSYRSYEDQAGEYHASPGHGQRLEGVPEHRITNSTTQQKRVRIGSIHQTGEQGEEEGMHRADSVASAAPTGIASDIARARQQQQLEEQQKLLASSSGVITPAAIGVPSCSSAGISSSSPSSPLVGAVAVSSGEGWQKLMNLKNLLSAGFITKTEYKDRKSQLIDEMTGTTLTMTNTNTAFNNNIGSVFGTNSSNLNNNHRAAPHLSHRVQLDVPTIIPRGPPDFTKIQPERATKYTYDLNTRSWNSTNILVKLDPVPFSRGALRLVYHLQDLQELEEEKERERLRELATAAVVAATTATTTTTAATTTAASPVMGSSIPTSTSTAALLGEGEIIEGEEGHPVAKTETQSATPPCDSNDDLDNISVDGSLSTSSSSLPHSSSSSSSLSISTSTAASSVSHSDVGDDPLLPVAAPMFSISSFAPGTATYVAKISMDPRDNADREIYFRDVEMQTVAKYYAALFNEYQPPKKVDFVKASILRLEEREGQPLCGVERYIEGTYRKWNNNFGFVSEDERNTPQAFSHFTYETSSHRMLICDIQGVSDMYTDPQVHSIEPDGFGGKGNLGQRGIDRFLQTHRCNAICRYLKLPSINANYSDLGTLPITQYMSYEQVQVVNIHHFPRTAGSQQLISTATTLPATTQNDHPHASNNNDIDDSTLILSADHSSTNTNPQSSNSKNTNYLRSGDDMEEQHCKGFCNIL